jgi:citrate lyase subunit beta/citryl-CoA lyase
MLRRLRSVLFVPGTRPDRFASAEAAGADAVVFDLEDSVEAGRKPDARRAIGEWFARAAGPTPSAVRLVRVNAAGSSWFADDLGLVRGLAHVDGVVLPKAETAYQVTTAAAGASAMATLPVIPLLETSRGVLHAAAIAAARVTVPALLFGAEDLTAELGVPRTVDGDELIFARSQVVLAAASVGADAIDAVFTSISATDGLRRDALRARALGFHGKMAIHPAQIATIHDVFTPTPDELAQAQRIVDAYDAAARDGSGVFRLDDQMIDAPVATRARKLLALARDIDNRQSKIG